VEKEIEKLIDWVYYIPYSNEAFGKLDKAISLLEEFINKQHFLKEKIYHNYLNEIKDMRDELSDFTSSDDKLLQKKLQQKIAYLARTILDENKKIFIVHGRNIPMRDKVSSLLGRLKLDYVILESEFNNGATVIEKFLRNASTCRYAIVLFSADDVGGIEKDEVELRPRVRQNVILELGYFLGTIGRENIIILHEVGKRIEKPTDFDGIVYEPFDEYGAWKGKVIKEMKKAKIYIDKSLEERI
jgi:predicted nucleotide-binding protein